MARKALAAYLASSAGFTADEHERGFAQSKRLVKPLQHFAPALAVATDQHAVGMGEIADRRAFAQEFPI